MAQKKILVTEDEEQWQRRVVDALAKEGYAVFLASIMRDAFRQMDEHQFDLLVLDNNLDLDRNVGVELLRMLRQDGNKVPVIIHSHDLTPMQEADIEALGAVFVIKDAGAGQAQLLRVVAELL